jgi:hypothetical protein
MPWIIGGALLGAGAIGALGSTAAAGTQAAGQQQAAQTQLQMFDTITGQQQPFIQGGYGALNQLLYGLGEGPTSVATGPGGTLVPSGTAAATAPSPVPSFLPNIPNDIANAMLPQPSGPTATTGGRPAGRAPAGGPLAAAPPGVPGGAPGGALNFGQLTSNFTPQDFLNNVDPGYQFQLQTGGQAVRNADTPSLGALSGPALKDLMSFNQGLAGTAYQNAYNRFQTTNTNIFGRLSAIAGLGQNAAANVGAAGTQLGTGIAGAQAGAAASQAAGIVGATNAIGNAVSGYPLYSLLSANSGGGGGGGGYNFSNLPVNTVGQPGQSGT